MSNDVYAVYGAGISHVGTRSKWEGKDKRQAERPDAKLKSSPNFTLSCPKINPCSLT